MTIKKGLIFDIQRFCTHDGPGIRTTVFLKGCPLRCVWCHNPESIQRRKQILFHSIRCISCGCCGEVCQQGAHDFHGGIHTFDREKCKACLKCIESCSPGALEIVGKEFTLEQVINEIEKDRIFYEESGGGLTISGGEPTLQFEFSYNLLKIAKDSGIHTCIETCGYTSRENCLKLIPTVDLFLWDVKDTISHRHLNNTGVPLEPILNNLKTIDKAGAATTLRCILVKGINLDEEHMGNTAALYHELNHCNGVELLPYHPYGDSKSEKLGIPTVGHPEWIPQPELIHNFAEGLIKKDVPVILKGSIFKA